MKALMVLLATALADLLWAKYIQSVGDGKKLVASLWASTLYVLSAFVITAYVDDHSMVWVAAVGAFLGTYIGTKRKEAA